MHVDDVLRAEYLAAKAGDAVLAKLDDRQEPDLTLGIQRIAAAGGISSIAHPIRLGYRDPDKMRTLVSEMRDAGLSAIEVYHSDHRPADAGRHHDVPAPDAAAPGGRPAPIPKGGTGVGRADGVVI